MRGRPFYSPTLDDQSRAFSPRSSTNIQCDTKPYQNTAVSMAFEAGLLHSLSEKSGETVDAEALAKATGYNALFIGTLKLKCTEMQWLTW